MALFKISKGLSSNLSKQEIEHDGWCWFTTDDQMFHIDYLDNGVLKRAPLNANDTKTLTGASLKQELNNKADEIPSSAIVSTQIGRLETLIGQNSEEIDTKMDKENPTGSGTFNFNTSGATGTNAVAFGGHAEGSNSFAFGNQSRATGQYSFAYGFNAKATGDYSYCEGRNNEASGVDSHAEGFRTLASAQGAHSEGRGTTASGNGSHAEGNDTIASGVNSHAEGNSTTAAGYYSHTSGFGTTAKTKSQFVIGEFNLLDSKITAHSRGDYVFIIGKGTADDARSNAMTVDWNGDFWTAGRMSHASGIATGGASFASGSGTASGEYSHAEGAATLASGVNSHAEGNATNAQGINSHAEGEQAVTGENSRAAHAEGYQTQANGNYSHAEGNGTEASGVSSHAEGSGSIASGDYSHTEGYNTTASNTTSHAEGDGATASGYCSHAEGIYTTASGRSSHAEGVHTTASNESSHAEGFRTEASGNASHAEGDTTTASGGASHAGGESTIAAGERSFTHGFNLTANGVNQAVFGKYNTPNTTDIFQIGGGSSDTDRANAFSITALGAAKIRSSLNIGGATDNSGRPNLLYVSGDGYVEGGIRAGSSYYPSDNKDLVTKDYIVNNLPILSHKYITAVEAQTAFDFADQGITSLENYYLVFYDGLLLIEGLHYTISSSKTSILLSEWAANAGHTIQVVGFAPISPDTN